MRLSSFFSLFNIAFVMGCQIKRIRRKTRKNSQNHHNNYQYDPFKFKTNFMIRNYTHLIFLAITYRKFTLYWLLSLHLISQKAFFIGVLLFHWRLLFWHRLIKCIRKLFKKVSITVSLNPCYLTFQNILKAIFIHLNPLRVSLFMSSLNTFSRGINKF